MLKIDTEKQPSSDLDLLLDRVASGIRLNPDLVKIEKLTEMEDSKGS